MEYIELVIAIVLPAILIIVGMMVGRITESRHFANLNLREQATQQMLVTDLRSFPGTVGVEPTPQLVIGEVVIAADYFKTFIAGLKKLIGGELRSYERILDRARREAVLRVLEQAQAAGYDAVCNMRIETAQIVGSEKQAKAKAAAAAIIASGTAYKRRVIPAG
jgi:uncharacterized protein YbjQ (UPF0145 family)